MLDLKLLLSLKTVAEEGNLSRAAVRLNLSQPALSRRIQELERSLQFPLFEHVGRGIRLTGEGLGFLARCQDLLAHADTVEDEVQFFARGKGGVIRIGASPQMLERLFPDVLVRYREDFPRVRVDLVEDTTQNLLERLVRGDIHLAVAPPQNDSRFDYYPLSTLIVLAAMARTHPLGASAQISLEDVAKSPVLLLHAGYLSRQAFDAACRLAHVAPRVILESGAPATLLALAAAGLGIAIVPSVVRLDGRRLHAAPLIHDGHELRIHAAICWKRGRYMAPYAEQLVERLTAAAERKLVMRFAKT